MKFSQKILRIGDFQKLIFIELATLNFFFQKKKNSASSLLKLVTNYEIEWVGLNFYYNDGLQPKKKREGIINEHGGMYILCN